MSGKKYKNISNEPESLKDLLANYRNTGITFSSIETQGDIQLINNLNRSPEERLKLMNILNEYAFRNINTGKHSLKNAHIIFSSYEYIP